MAFCKWLGAKEGKSYRRPTEAEWKIPAAPGPTNFFGAAMLRRQTMSIHGTLRHGNRTAAVCYDWHGEYPATDQTDPVGYAAGWAKIVRGGPVRSVTVKDASGKYLLAPDMSPVWFRCANRCSLMPDTPKFDKDHPCHFVGFRIVEGELPETAPLPWIPDFPMEGVKQTAADWSARPDPQKPYCKARVLIPSPPDLTTGKDCAAVGLNRAIQGKIHSGGITWCPNGDLISISFSSSPDKSESAPNTCMVITRLGRGAEEWDMPGLFYKISGLNDQSGLLWNDNGVIWFFGGGRDLGKVPFRFTTSKDSGATWSELRPAVVTGSAGRFVAQPITSAFRGPDGTIYVGLRWQWSAQPPLGQQRQRQNLARHRGPYRRATYDVCPPQRQPHPRHGRQGQFHRGLYADGHFIRFWEDVEPGPKDAVRRAGQQLTAQNSQARQRPAVLRRRLSEHPHDLLAAARRHHQSRRVRGPFRR